MIKVEHLNKYYNKGKSNEIHVINDVSFEFPEKGFITILGKSGSGKTTLLNVISGLDSADSGTISYRQGLKVFEKYEMGRMDHFRIRNIGYIFQNYLILPEETVFENVDDSLKLCGIQDAKERKIRTNAALKAVGMSKYRRKYCSALSGGQKQRVGIARALAKMPKIIIADEPTGNLDSENSIEIMRILKDISKNYLVVMVTHNERLAWAFGDRIINYKDGKIISDVLNDENTKKSYELGRPRKEDNILYLSDYKENKLEKDGVSASVFAADPSKINLNIKIIERDGKRYLFVDDENIIINDRMMEIVDKRPEVLEEDKIEEKGSTFDASGFTKVNRHPVPFFTLFKQAFFNFFHEKKMRTGAFKVLSAILGVGLAVVAIVTYFTFYTADYSNAQRALDTDSYSLGYANSDVTIPKTFDSNLFTEAVTNQEESGITGIVTSYTINAYNFGLGKVTGVSDSYACAAIRIPQVNGENPSPRYGSKPDLNGIMVSKGAIDLAMPEFTKRGYKYESLLGKNFLSSTGTRLYNNSSDVSPVITGIVDEYKPYIYLSNEGAVSQYDALIGTHTYIPDIYGRNRRISFSLLERINFMSRDEASYTEAITGTRNAASINVIISSAAENLFNEDFAVDRNFYNVVGVFESNENIAIFDEDSDFEAYQELEGADSLLATRFYSEVPVGLELADGRLPTKPNEFLVSENNTIDDDSIVGHYKKADHNIGVVYTSIYTSIVNNYEQIRNLPGSYYGVISENFSSSYKTSLYVKDFAKADKYLKNIEEYYQLVTTTDALNEANNKTLNSDSKIIMLAVCGGILVLMFAIVTIATRSNMIRQIYTISVFRSLGASRKDLHKMFIAKDLVSFLLTMFSGIVATYVLSWIILGSLGLYLAPFWLFIITSILAYGLSLLGTMIPLWGLLSKTPTKISTKYDI